MSTYLNRSLRITFGVSLALVLLQGILSYVVVVNFRGAIRANVDKQQFALVTSLAHEVDDKIQEHERLIAEIANAAAPEAFAGKESARAFLKKHGEAAIVFDHGLFIFAADGRLLAERPLAPTAAKGEFPSRDYLKQVIERRMPVVSPPYASGVTGEPVVLFAAPVLGRDGRLKGILGGALSLLHDNFLSNIAQGRVGSSGYIYLFGTDRTIIVHPDRARIMKKDVPVGANLMFDRAIAGYEGSGETVNSKGVPTVASFKRLTSAPWILAANFPVQEAYAPLRKAIRNLVVALAFTIIGSCLALYLIARRMKGEVAKRAEAEDHARLLLESVGEGVLGVTADGAISFANKAALELLGYAATEQLLGQDVRDVLHHTSPDCPHCPRENCRIYPTFNSGMVQRSENELLQRRDGSIFVADFCCTPVWHQGTLHGAVMTFRDVSERKETEERLRLQGAALEAAANSILITDHDDRIIWANESFTKLTGYSREEAIGRAPHDLLAGRHDEQMFSELRDALRSKRSWHGELVTRRKDGSLYDEDVTVTPVLDEHGNISNFVGIMQDISQRKQAEEALMGSKQALEESNRQLLLASERAAALALRAERASAAKSRFLANMSHEIRTPMHAIIGMSHLLKETHLAKKQGDYLQIICSSAESLLGIINDILDFSKIEAGKLEIGRIAFCPEDVIGEALAMVGPRAAEKRLGLRRDLDQAIPPLLVGDPLRLSQILNNLLNNAVKFTHSGEVALSVRVAERNGEQLQLEFAVRDTGDGISRADQSHLFQAFEQVDGSSTRNYGGTGLGLAICRQLTTMMGGRIWCESTPGQGSTFSFALPFAIVSNPDSAALKGGASCERMIQAGQRVLLVEDNEFNQQVAVALLERAGLQVTVAGNGLEAVELVKQQEFQLVLMDVQMPVLDGLSATRRIRALAKTGVDSLPIVAMSANAMEQDVRACLAAGMNGHIAKPFMPDEMYAVISRYLPAQPQQAFSRDSVPSPGKDPAGPLAKIPGLDMEMGIRQLGGNQKLYGELLRRFVSEYGEGIAELKAAIGSGDRKGAAILVHSIKGVAGVLAAVPLQEAAQELESALREESREVEPLSLRFIAELEGILLSLGNRPPAASPPAEGALVEQPPPELDDLEAALRACDPTVCATILTALGESRWPAYSMVQLKELGMLINDYRYEEALAALARLRHLLPAGTIREGL